QRLNKFDIIQGGPQKQCPGRGVESSVTGPRPAPNCSLDVSNSRVFPQGRLPARGSGERIRANVSLFGADAFEIVVQGVVCATGLNLRDILSNTCHCSERCLPFSVVCTAGLNLRDILSNTSHCSDWVPTFEIVVQGNTSHCSYRVPLRLWFKGKNKVLPFSVVCAAGLNHRDILSNTSHCSERWFKGKKKVFSFSVVCAAGLNLRDILSNTSHCSYRVPLRLWFKGKNKVLPFSVVCAAGLNHRDILSNTSHCSERGKKKVFLIQCSMRCWTQPPRYTDVVCAAGLNLRDILSNTSHCSDWVPTFEIVVQGVVCAAGLNLRDILSNTSHCSDWVPTFEIVVQDILSNTSHCSVWVPLRLWFKGKNTVLPFSVVCAAGLNLCPK
ncbi:hypothetical protein J6590_105192, partial [Homalodisca vitripennis]